MEGVPPSTVEIRGYGVFSGLVVIVLRALLKLTSLDQSVARAHLASHPFPSACIASSWSELRGRGSPERVAGLSLSPGLDLRIDAAGRGFV